jgi:uncharacterized protein
MELTKYLKVIEPQQGSGDIVLIGTKKGSIISVSRAMLTSIKSGKSGEISDEERVLLVDLGFLIEHPDAERAEMLGFIDEINSISRTLAVKLVMNLDCNLDCRYCFEGQRKGKFFMSRETADRFVEFVRTWTDALGEKTGNEQIVITFYGGEPLLNLELITYISEKITGLAKASGIEFVSYMVTNGTLLTPHVVERLNPLGFGGAVVTLDGPKEIHDSFRPYKGGSGSFDVIFKNLKEICRMTGIQIGGNYMPENYRNFPRLLDCMQENGLSPDLIETVRFSPVTAESDGYGPCDFDSGCCSLNEAWLADAALHLREEVLRRGYKVPDKILPGICSLDLKDNLLVNYDGSLYKCPCLIGRDEFKVGDLRSGIMHQRQPQGLDSWQNEECLECVYLPICFGGCRAMKLVRDGNMEGVDCKKAYLDATLESVVKQDIKYGLTAYGASS